MKIYFDSGVLVSAFKQINERFHSHSKLLLESIRSGEHEGETSELSIVEFAGAFASNTRAPIEQVVGMLSTLQSQYHLRFTSFGDSVIESIEFQYEFRELKRKYGIPSADLYHAATSKSVRAHFLASVDARHLLRDEVRSTLKHHIVILNPEELCKILNVQ